MFKFRVLTILFCISMLTSVIHVNTTPIAVGLRYGVHPGEVYTFKVTRVDPGFDPTIFSPPIVLGNQFTLEILSDMGTVLGTIDEAGGYFSLNVTDTRTFFKYTEPDGNTSSSFSDVNGLLNPLQASYVNGTVLSLYDILSLTYQGSGAIVKDLGNVIETTLVNPGVFTLVIDVDANTGVIKSETVTDSYNYQVVIEQLPTIEPLAVAYGVTQGEKYNMVATRVDAGFDFSNFIYPIYIGDTWNMTVVGDPTTITGNYQNGSITLIDGVPNVFEMLNPDKSIDNTLSAVMGYIFPISGMLANGTSIGLSAFAQSFYGSGATFSENPLFLNVTFDSAYSYSLSFEESTGVLIRDQIVDANGNVMLLQSDRYIQQTTSVPTTSSTSTPPPTDTSTPPPTDTSTPPPTGTSTPPPTDTTTPQPTDTSTPPPTDTTTPQPTDTASPPPSTSSSAPITTSSSQQPSVSTETSSSSDVVTPNSSSTPSLPVPFPFLVGILGMFSFIYLKRKVIR